jgi:hypothetical protein
MSLAHYQMCNKGHEPIAFSKDSLRCPLCEARQDLLYATSALEDLKNQFQAYKDAHEVDPDFRH